MIKGIQSYREKDYKDKIIYGEGFKGYNHTGRRIIRIKSYREKLSRDTIILGEGH